MFTFTMLCPLCQSTTIQPLVPNYLLCSICDLRFLVPTLRLGESEEKVRYELHDNNPIQTGYQNFLAPLIQAVKSKFPAHAKGLDFGSGPTPALANWLTGAGYKMECYDPYYSPEASVLNQKYDFIVTSEVVEHLYNPNAEFQKIYQCLNPGGWLMIMTHIYDGQDFENWYYRRDPTHVVFYSEKTFAWIKNHFHFSEMTITKPRLILLRK